MTLRISWVCCTQLDQRHEIYLHCCLGSTFLHTTRTSSKRWLHVWAKRLPEQRIVGSAVSWKGADDLLSHLLSVLNILSSKETYALCSHSVCTPTLFDTLNLVAGYRLQSATCAVLVFLDWWFRTCKPECKCDAVVKKKDEHIFWLWETYGTDTIYCRDFGRVGACVEIQVFAWRLWRPRLLCGKEWKKLIKHRTNTNNKDKPIPSFVSTNLYPSPSTCATDL